MSKEIFEKRDKSLEHLRNIYGDEVEMVIAEARYGFISGLLREVLKRPTVEKLTLSDKVDKIVINRWLGIPLFLAVMYGMFEFTFKVSTPLMNWIDGGFGWLGEKAAEIGGWAGSLLSDGIIGGVGSVLVFIPPIFLLFLVLSLLEDLGYLARAAFVMDRVMHKVGLHGRSFVPLVLGFGCNVPAIMATRTIENPKDRLTTILINPLMSCGARLPIYVLFAGTFFTAHQGLIVLSMYLIGIALAILMAFALRKWVLPGPSGHFVMELPPYRLPTLKSILLHTWERGKVFLIRAGTIIFGVVVLVWVLDYTGILEPIGRVLAPLLAPCGFGQWQAAVSLAFGFLAKETVVGTMGMLFAGSEEVEGLGHIIGFTLGWNALIAFAFMAFSLIYVPCVATIGVIRRETNSWKWTGFSVAYLMGLAWIVAALIYQIGRLFV